MNVRHLDKVMVFSLRKSKWGLASVCLAALFLAGASVSADQNEGEAAAETRLVIVDKEGSTQETQPSQKVEELVELPQEASQESRLVASQEALFSDKKDGKNEAESLAPSKILVGEDQNSDVKEGSDRKELTVDAGLESKKLEAITENKQDQAKEKADVVTKAAIKLYQEGEEHLLDRHHLATFYKVDTENVLPKPLAAYRRAWEEVRILLMKKGLVEGSKYEQTLYPLEDVDPAILQAASEGLAAAKQALFYRDMEGVHFLPLEEPFRLPEVPEDYWAPSSKEEIAEKQAEHQFKGFGEQVFQPDTYQDLKQNLAFRITEFTDDRFTPQYLNSKDLRYNYYLDSTLIQLDDLVHTPDVSYEELIWADRKFDFIKNLMLNHSEDNNFSDLLDAYFEARTEIYAANYDKNDYELKPSYSKDNLYYADFQEKLIQVENLLKGQRLLYDEYVDDDSQYGQKDLDKFYSEYKEARDLYLGQKDSLVKTDANYVFPKNDAEIKAFEAKDGTDHIRLAEDHEAYHAKDLAEKLQDARVARFSERYINSKDPHFNQLLDQAILRGKQLVENPKAPNPQVKLQYQYLEYLIYQLQGQLTDYSQLYTIFSANVLAVRPEGEGSLFQMAYWEKPDRFHKVFEDWINKARYKLKMTEYLPLLETERSTDYPYIATPQLEVDAFVKEGQDLWERVFQKD